MRLAAALTSRHSLACRTDPTAVVTAVSAAIGMLMLSAGCRDVCFEARHVFACSAAAADVVAVEPAVVDNATCY